VLFKTVSLIFYWIHAVPFCEQNFCEHYTVQIKKDTRLKKCARTFGLLKWGRERQGGSARLVFIKAPNWLSLWRLQWSHKILIDFQILLVKSLTEAALFWKNAQIITQVGLRF